jgi:hypothetical protein
MLQWPLSSSMTLSLHDTGRRTGRADCVSVLGVSNFQCGATPSQETDDSQQGSDCLTTSQQLPGVYFDTGMPIVSPSGGQVSVINKHDI